MRLEGMCWKVDFCLFARENVPESFCFSFLKIQLEILKFNAYTLVYPVYRNSTNLATQKSLAEELEMKNFLGKRRLQSQHSGRTTPLGTKTSGTTTFLAAKTIEISFPSATRWALFVWLGFISCRARDFHPQGVESPPKETQCRRTVCGTHRN